MQLFFIPMDNKHITIDSCKLSNKNRSAEVEKENVTDELSITDHTSPQTRQVIGTPVGKLTGSTFHNVFNNEKTGGNGMDDNQKLNSEKGSTGELDDHQEENKDSKSDGELEPSNAIVKFLRNIKCNHPVAFNRIFAAVSITLFIIATYMPLYGKVLLCLLELVIIAVNYIAGDIHALSESVYLFFWLLVAFFSLITWPISAYACILMFICMSSYSAEGSFEKKDYLGLITSVFGPAFIILSFVFPDWARSVKPKMIYVSAVSFLFFITIFCNIGLVYKLVKFVKNYIDRLFYNLIKKGHNRVLKIKNQELAKLNNEEASQNKEKIDELKKEIEKLEQNLEFVEGKITDNKNETISLDEIYGLTPYTESCNVLKSFSKYWFIVLPVVSIIAGTGLLFMICYLDSKMPVSEYIPLFFQKLKDSLFLMSIFISNTSA
ncbi:hypothetical protein NEMIN01_0299 [Nematocida minor]|uniref:uncharacterized protein n=1 Tax=Nematocida minor TaxID=1912983 RepID=UPI0022202B86|nr:uncharacterized protein NEMIN01_0299 [Nematocida minor]KAI5189133.1 hypothetical protein NEMIN01_0299 [Nematocida minor]